MAKLFIVRFIRSDDLPCEEYCYWNIEEANAHYELYCDDSRLISADSLSV